MQKGEAVFSHFVFSISLPIWKNKHTKLSEM